MTQSLTPLHEFTLPIGYADAAGRTHRRGLMRLATAYDEIEPLSDPRVQQNEAFLGLLLLSRVITRLGEFSPVPPEVIAGLYTADFAFLQELYAEVNTPMTRTSFGTIDRQASGATPAGNAPQKLGTVETVCPNCGAELVLDLDAT